MATLYKIQHRTCGHIAGVGNTREEGERILAALQATGNHGWRLHAVTSRDEALHVLAELAADAKCDWCRVPGQVGAVTGTGIKVDATGKAGADMTDPGPGLHLWTVSAAWKVTPTAEGQYNLDTENLLTVQGPGCFKCERLWSVELAAVACTGSMELQ